MADLDRWLREQGLEQHSKLFAENDIDFEGLACLAEADLEALGLSLGHRRKLMRGIDTWRRATPGSTPAAPDSTQPSTADAPDAERRQITVMFCDMVGSTELANMLDPEDTSALIRRHQEACAGAVARFHGFVAKFMGDGILVYFGYPQANEDAPEHAVRAALAVIDAVKDIARPDGQPCQVRIGIATGLVVIGDMLGAGSARERSIAGDTPNLAARLQALADPGAILIGPRTHRLLGNRFEYDSLGERSLKGFAAPVHVWRVLGETSIETRFAATRSAGRGAFVGRIAESSALDDRWRRACDSKGQFVVISGEAGMGKSRLADMLSDRVAGEKLYRINCQCSPYHTNSALHPVIRHLERAAGFTPGDPVAARLAKLEAMLDGRDAKRARPATALVADLLSLPTDGFPPIDLAPPQRKAATLAALAEILTRLAADAPVLLLLEDAHWIDPTTRELWTRLADGIAATRMLAIVTARPEFASPWPERGHISRIDLMRLTAAESAELVAGIAAPQVLDHGVVADIVAKSDGVPLYIEELTKSVLESTAADQQAVPATLHDSLLARLDRLGPAKDIAQVAAVIGQRFSHALLAEVDPHPAAELTEGLLRLVEAGLVYRGGGAEEPSYSFKHALLRDVAYENLLRARRQQLHERIGRTLVERFAAVTDAEPELLAHHFHHAGLFDLALDHRERAGDRAVARSSYAEGVAHFTVAIAEAAQLPPGPESASRELGLLLKLGPPVTILKGAQSPEAADVYSRARELAATKGDAIGLYKATWGLWYTSILGRRLDRARDRAEELVALARNSGNDDLLLEGIHCHWSTAQFRGELSTALELTLEGVRTYDRARHSWMGPIYGGHDPGVCAFSVRANALSLCGRRADARHCLEQALALAEALKHPNSVAHAMLNVLVTLQNCDDHQAVEDYAERAIAHADRYNLPPVRAHAQFLAGWALAHTSSLDVGLAVMEAEYPRASAIGPYFRYYAALLAEGRARVGRVSDALTLLNQALSTVTEPGVGFYVSELYRLMGVCQLRGDAMNRDDGMHALRTAVDMAKRHGATLLELRAAVSLARAAMTLGMPEPDLDPLRELCARLPPEFESPILGEANQLLADTRR